MRHRINKRHPLTEKDIARNKVINAVYDSRLARNSVHTFGADHVTISKDAPRTIKKFGKK